MGSIAAICTVSEETRQKIKQFRSARCTGTNALIITVDANSRLLEVEETLENCSIEELRGSLPDRFPRFILLCRRFQHSDGRISYPLIVIYLSPSGCNPTTQMMYAGSLHHVVNESGVNKFMECNELEELTDSSIDESLSSI